MWDMNKHTSRSEFPNLNHSYMVVGRRAIEEALCSADNLAVKAKVGWLARYFNQYAAPFGLPEIQIT